MNIQPRYITSPENDAYGFPPYSPIATELDGLSRIKNGIGIIWFEVTEGNYAYWRRKEERTTDDGFCCCLGVASVVTGLWQLRVPLVMESQAAFLHLIQNYFGNR